ncbi:MAG: hypothetical protein PHQ34_06085 [Methanothrix sp.]|nr:hypothetical protein [Methanothrix sp.]
MDHVVHINNGSGAAKPIVLRLLPGEETIFNLKVLNDGEPSNISLQASSPVFKAVRLKKPDHYVVLEEVVPILARMPADKKRLDGEILLTSGSGVSKVPITLLRDSEDPGDDLEDPGLQGDKELRDYGADEEDEDLDPEDRLITGRDRDDADDEAIDDDDDEYGPESIRRGKGGEDEDDLEDESEGTEKEPRRISFSRDRDLERYRSARKRKAGESAEGRDDGPVQMPAKSRAGRHRAAKDSAEDRRNGNGRGKGSGISNSKGDLNAEDDGDRDANEVNDDNSDRIVRIDDRSRSRIDDRFVDPSNKQDEIPRFVARKVPFAEPEEWKEERDEVRTGAWAEERRDEGLDEWQEVGREERQEPRMDERMRPASDYENRFRSPGQEFDGMAREVPISSSDADADSSERIPEDPGAYSEQDDGSQSDYLDRLGDIGGTGSIKVVPAILFLALVIVLAMTFITMNIPEFPGALASSILIVTLIIYGAATLLKA